MNFLLSAEQNEIQRSVERYLDEQIDTTKLHQLFDDDSAAGGFDPALWAGLAELGVFGMSLPEAHGGLGLEMIDLALIAETVGSRAAPLPFLGHALATLAIAWAGSDEQRARWLPGLIDGSSIAALAVGDGKGGWEPEQWSLAAGATLDGTLPLVPGAQFAQLFVVGLAGGQLAVVERAAAGVGVTPRASSDRTRRLASLSLAGTPCALLPDGVAQSARLRDAALVLLAADAFGGALRCATMAVAYAKERVQYGQPIGQFQAVKHQLADLTVAVEPARGIYWYAAHAFDHREPAEAAQMAALAKSHLADVYVAAARRCIELHGGMGYAWEADPHVFLRRAMFDHAWMGTPGHHRARAAALAGW